MWRRPHSTEPHLPRRMSPWAPLLGVECGIVTTTAYFHRPEEIRQECLDAGLDVLTVLGVEGLAGWLSHLAERWDVPADREVILRSAAITEDEESLLGMSAHLIAVAAVQ